MARYTLTIKIEEGKWNRVFLNDGGRYHKFESYNKPLVNEYHEFDKETDRKAKTKSNYFGIKQHEGRIVGYELTNLETGERFIGTKDKYSHTKWK